MLAYAFQQLKQNNYEDIAGEKFDEIHDLFAEILIRGISYQLKSILMCTNLSLLFVVSWTSMVQSKK